MAKCLEDFRNLFGAGSQPKLCYKPDADEKPVEEDHEISEHATNLLPCIMLYLLILCVCFGLLTYFSGNHWQKVRDSPRLVRRYIGWVLASLLSNIPFVGDYFGGDSKQKLLFVPDADNKPGVDHEISEAALFRFLLNEETLKEFREGTGAEIPEMLNVLKDIDKQSKITEFETHQSSMGLRKDLRGAFHVFIVFKTISETEGVYWWSLEKGMDYITLQRCRNKENVKDKCYDEPRIEVKSIVENLEGKGTMKDLIALLWVHQMIPEKYNILNSNCQSFVTCISQQITETGYKYQGYFKYSPPHESGREKKMFDLINILRGGFSKGSILIILILMENINLFDKIVASGKYDINAFYNGYTPLDLAIMFSKTKMVKYLLKPPINADLTRGDESRRNALQWAATTTMNAEIIDLLLAHVKVKIDDVDRDGQTALHWAASTSNVIAVEKLLEKGANPNIGDKEGVSPLHVAVQEKSGNAIFDLLLAHPKVKVDNVDENGQTALHWAARVSNVIAVRKLIENGANPSIFDRSGVSPLHVAAEQRDGNHMIKLLLEAQKVKGLGDVNDRDKKGRTALHYAAMESNAITAEHLIEKGADVNHRDNDGRTPLHDAVIMAKDMNIIDLLLENINEGDIQQYRNDKGLFFFARHNLQGLEEEIIDRLLEKGIIKPPSTKTDECWTEESDDESTGVNAHRFEEEGVDPSIDLTGLIIDFLIARVENSQENDEILKEEEFDINGRDQDGQTLLFFAIRANNVNGVRRLLENGADPTIPNNKGLSPFFLAVGLLLLNKDPGILNLLLKSGKVDINETIPGQGATALHLVILKYYVTDARFLLSNGANPNAADENGYTPLHAAVFLAKDMDIVELLVNHKDTDVNCLDNEGRTALDYAKENFHGHGERIAKLLKEKGGVETEKRLPNVTKERIKKHMRVFSNQKPRKVENFLSDATVPIEDKIVKISDEYLYSAIINSDVERIRQLLKNGADISACGEKGANAFHLASRYAKTTDLIDVILETGKFDINGGDSTGHTSLHYAIMGTRWEINVRHLIRKGADPNIANKKGYTPLHYVAFHAKRMEITSLFVEKEQVDIIHHSAHFHSSLTEGMTGIYSALSFKPVEIARCLMENGADPTIRGSNDGLTPFHLASAVLTDTDVLDLMLGNEKQINIEERENLGRTALHLALATSNFDAARFLLSKGADPNVIDEKGLTPLHVAAFHANGLGEAIANLLREKGAAKAEGNNHGTENMAALLDSHTETILFLIESGMDISAMTWGENGMNALNVLAATIEKITKRIDSLQETNLHAGPTAPKCCTSDDNNDKMGNEVLKEAIKHSDVEKVRNLIEMGTDLSKTTWGKGMNALHVASQNAKKTEILDVILETGDFDINGGDENGRTALYYAMLDENVETVRYLLGKGADPTIYANDGLTPFHMAAAFSRESDILDLFLATNKKFDIDFRNQSGRTALHMAVIESNTATAEFLLSKGANPNVTDKDGVTPLHVAALVAKDMDIVKLLINHKDTDVNCLVNGGRNALDFAMDNMFGLDEAIVNLLREKMAAKAEGDDYEPKNMAASVPAGCIKQDSDMETIRYLLEDGQDISEMTWGENGANALHLAAAKNEEKTDLIDAILETGKFDIDGVDNNGRTPLYWAIATNNLETVRHLIQKGADPTVANKNGHTPLHAAVYHIKSIETVSLLLEKKQVDINRRDKNGLTALHYAIDAMEIEQSNNVEMVRYLLKKGADPTIRNNNGTTPFHTSTIFLTNTDVLGLMLENEIKIDIDEKKNDGLTALHIAIGKSKLTTARFLLSKGANPNVTDKNGATPLHVAALLSKDMDMIKLLVNHPDVDVNYLDNRGYNALVYAMGNKHGLGEEIANLLREKMALKAEGNNHELENMAASVPGGRIKEDSDNVKTIRLLIEDGQDVSAMTWGDNGANALHLVAADEKAADLIDVILETGKFDINGVDNDGRTPLHYAIKRPKSITINSRRLIKMGANPSVPDKNGVTPLHMAARNAESMDLIELLLNTEAVDVNHYDHNGTTPLAYARANKHGIGQRIIARLKEYDDEKK